MVRDLNDSLGWVQRLIRRVERIESGAMLENSSVTAGRMRFIGGLLLIDSGGTLQVVGRFDGTGDFEWSGPWKFDSGNGEIAGDVKLSGDFTLSGKLAAGNVRIEGGKIYAGNVIIDPSSNGGSVKFAGGPEVYANGDTLSLYSGTGAFIELNGAMVKINGPGARWIEVTSSGVRVAGLPSRSGTGLPSGAVGADVDGTLWRAS